MDKRLEDALTTRKEKKMKGPLYRVSEQIKDIVDKNGSITLFELEETLKTSYNLIFLAIDNMITNNQVNLRRCGKDYILKGVEGGSRPTSDDACVIDDECIIN